MAQGWPTRNKLSSHVPQTLFNYLIHRIVAMCKRLMHGLDHGIIRPKPRYSRYGTKPSPMHAVMFKCPNAMHVITESVGFR